MVSTYAEQDGAVLPVPVPSGNTAITDLLELLAGRDLLVAPHVASRLLEYLDGDVEAVAETVSVLSPDQRRGTRVLPDPLPLTPAVAERFSDLALEPWERRLLLTAAVCVDDDTDVLRAVSGRSMDEIIAGEPGRRLVFVAGHFAFADLRLRQWSHESADLAARTKTHLELHRAYLSLGDDRRALWHLSLGTMQGEAALTRPLLELARTTAAEGDAERAFAVAREAMSHAGPADVEAARLTAGLAALRAGLRWSRNASARRAPPARSGGTGAVSRRSSRCWGRSATTRRRAGGG